MHLHISLRVTRLIPIEKSDGIPVLLYIPIENISFIRKDTKNPFLPWSQLGWARCCGWLDTIDRLPKSKVDFEAFYKSMWKLKTSKAKIMD